MPAWFAALRPHMPIDASGADGRRACGGLLVKRHPSAAVWDLVPPFAPARPAGGAELQGRDDGEGGTGN